MDTLHEQITTLLLNAVVIALKDFDTELEVDTSLDVSGKRVPLLHVKEDLQMTYLREKDSLNLVIFQYNLLSDYIARTAEDEGLSFIFEGCIISLIKYSDGSIKFFAGANSDCNEICSSEELTGHGIVAEKVFSYIEDLIQHEI